MRILTLCYEFPPVGGGGSRVVSGLARALVAAGHEVDVITSGFRGLPRRSTVEGVRVYRVPSFRLREHYCTIPEAASYVAGGLPAARRLAGDRAHDIVHAHFIFPDGWMAHRLGRRGLPYVITAHGSDVPGYNVQRTRLAHRALAPVWRRTTRDAAAIVCPSRALASLVRARDPGIGTDLIPNGIDPDRFRTDRPRARRILVVTRLLERKGVQHLLRAVHDLPLRHEVHIAGEGPYRAELEELARGARPTIVFHGWLDNRSPELTRLFETSDIFVLPSDRENFPVCLLEAMAAGLAVVTTRSTGCAEVVGEAGLLVAPGSVAELRRALQRLTDDPDLRAALGRSARERVERELSWRVIARSYEALYERHRRPPGTEP